MASEKLKVPSFPQDHQTIEMFKKKALEAEAERRKAAIEVKAKLKKIGKKAELFKKDVIKKYKNEIKGILVLPPKDPSTDEFDLLILLKIDGELKHKLKKKADITKNIISIGSKKLPKGIKEIKIEMSEEKVKNPEGMGLNILLLDELWDMCHKGKYEVLQLIVIGLPIYESDWLTALRAMEVHKMRTLRKFEKYVISYSFGGSMVQGTNINLSDIDTYIVIDDTDVTRMTSQELRMRLTEIIWGYAAEAAMAVGLKGKLHPQVYVLTDMWDSIKNANPVIFTFLRDGIPLYDRGMFTPWKMLLKQGKITPSPEAIENYMKTGTKMLERTKLRLRDIGLEDFFWATFTPTQGALMLIGVPPGAPKEVPNQIREHFVAKGLLEEKYAKTIDEVLNLRKNIEYGTVKEVNPNKIISLLKKSEDYLKRLEKLFSKLEKGQVDNEIEDLYKKSLEDIQAALKMIEIKSTEKNALSLFKKHIVDTKLAPTRYFNLLSNINKIRKDPKSTTRAEIFRLQFEQEKLSHEVFNRLGADKGKKIEKYKISAVYDKGNKNASIWLFTDDAYIILDINRPNTPIKKFKISNKGELIKAQSTTLKEIEKKLTTFSGSPTTITKETIASLKRILADDVKIVIGS